MMYIFPSSRDVTLHKQCNLKTSDQFGSATSVGLHCVKELNVGEDF